MRTRTEIRARLTFMVNAHTNAQSRDRRFEVGRLLATQIGPLPQLITNTCDISPP